MCYSTQRRNAPVIISNVPHRSQHSTASRQTFQLSNRYAKFDNDISISDNAKNVTCHIELEIVYWLDAHFMRVFRILKILNSIESLARNVMIHFSRID